MIKIYINPVPGRIDRDIYILEEPPFRNPGDVINYFAIENNEVVFKSVSSDEMYKRDAVKPFMRLTIEKTYLLIDAFANFGKELGREIDSESKAKGKLEATERHLSDLRQLLKLK